VAGHPAAGTRRTPPAAPTAEAKPAEPKAAEPLVVGRVGRAHGVRGEVGVEVRTDAPDQRFAAGATLATEPAVRGPLQVRTSHWHSGRLIVAFEGIEDRDAAQALAGTLLLIDSSQTGDAGHDAWWDHELVGLRVQLADGQVVGSVRDVLHTGAQDLLVVAAEPGTPEVLVPFVAALVPSVDLTGGWLLLEPPPGLLPDQVSGPGVVGPGAAGG
jgi:16S rRNA processing protein RimM